MIKKKNKKYSTFENKNKKGFFFIFQNASYIMKKKKVKRNKLKDKKIKSKEIQWHCKVSFSLTSMVDRVRVSHIRERERDSYEVVGST